MRAWVLIWGMEKQPHLPTSKLWRINRFSVLFKELKNIYKKEKTSWLLLRTAVLRLEVTLTGIFTNLSSLVAAWAELENRFVLPAINYWLLWLSGRPRCGPCWQVRRCLFASLSPNWRKGAHTVKLQKKSQKSGFCKWLLVFSGHTAFDHIKPWKHPENTRAPCKKPGG